MKKINLIFSSLLIILLTGCFDMDKYPEGELSSINAFTSTSEISKYLNQFYESSVSISSSKSVNNPIIKVHGGGAGSASGIAFSDMNSDNMYGNVISTRLAGETALSNATSLDEYMLIRNVNFLLENISNCKEVGESFDQCLGEAYYFRASLYYSLLKNYGGVTWLTKVLDPIQEHMHLPRNGRIELTDSILHDLDLAIEYLPSKTDNSSMRVHKDVARALKSEIALFEATWEKYHKQKNTPFYDKSVTDDKIKDYLNQSITAAEEIINTGVWSITMGDPNKVYQELFVDQNLTSNKEVLWYKKYDASVTYTHSVTRYLNKGGGLCGVSASLVDDYLTIDGKPFVGKAKEEAKKIYGKELNPEIRDPRLSQTVCMPGQSLRPNGEYVFEYPPLTGNSYFQNTTGYSVLKHVEINTSYFPTIDGEGKSQTPAIQVRYADILLNYAEALAELNAEANAQKIQMALKPLRDRVGMPDVNFDREYNTDPEYPFKDLNKYIQAVRRERRVEQALEGTRLNDILRWAAADVLIKNKIPTGAMYTGSDLETHFADELVEGKNLFLTGSVGDTYRYIIPFNNTNYPNGWQFNLERDYLLPIQPRMISLTGEQWVQNPGW